MSYASTIKSVWRTLFGFDVDAKRAPLPPAEEHSRQIQQWLNRKPRTIRYMSREEIEALRLDIIDTLISSGSSRERAEELTGTLGKNLGDVCPQPSTSRVDAILAESDQARANGLVWDVETHTWQPPKPTPRRARATAKSNGPVTAKIWCWTFFPVPKSSLRHPALKIGRRC